MISPIGHVHLLVYPYGLHLYTHHISYGNHVIIAIFFFEIITKSLKISANSNDGHHSMTTMSNENGDDSNNVQKVHFDSKIIAIHAPDEFTIGNSSGISNKFELSFDDYMCKLYVEQAMIDAIIINGDSGYPIHRIMLAVKSPKYLEIFDPNNPTTSTFKIELENEVPKKSMIGFINYMYTGVIKLREGILDGILHLSRVFELPQLYDYAIQHITNSINIHNVIHYLRLAIHYEIVPLKTDILNLVSNDFNRLSKSRLDILSIDYEDFRMIIESLPPRNKNLHTLQIITRWIRAQPEQRREMAADLLKLISLEQISREELVIELEMRTDLAEIPEVNFLLHQACKSQELEQVLR
ncbi:hypothetical protein CHUAL_003316 [Chamberlinius hualienensis]